MFTRLLILIFIYLNLASCSWPVLRALPIIGESYETPIWKERKTAQSPAFKATLEKTLGTTFTSGNRITTYLNGDQIFPAMFDEISKAQSHIYLESYIVWRGQVAEKLVQHLTERAKKGVNVNVIFDWHGSDAGEYRDLLEDAGAEVELYNALSWYNPYSWKDLGNLDNRTHRRILVVDGKIAMTGGAAFADEWLGHASNENEFRDTHYKFEGPAVSYIEGVFSENWWSSDRSFAFKETSSPPIEGGLEVQVARSSPGIAIPAGITTFSTAIEAAERSIKIATPYFVPEDLLLDQLSAAAKRGVKIEIILPGRKADKAVVRTASRGMWGDLLRNGVKIYEYQPSLIHSKVMIVDDLFVTLGTSNWDSRSLRLNDEIIVNVLDSRFAEEQNRILEKDKLKSKLVTYEEWKNRPFWERVFDTLAGTTRDEL